MKPIKYYEAKRPTFPQRFAASGAQNSLIPYIPNLPSLILTFTFTFTKSLLRRLNTLQQYP